MIIIFITLTCKQAQCSDMTYNSVSRNIGVASASFYNLPAGVEGEEEEDNEHKAENREHYHAHNQIHCTEGSAHVVWGV